MRCLGRRPEHGQSPTFRTGSTVWVTPNGGGAKRPGCVIYVTPAGGGIYKVRLNSGAVMECGAGQLNHRHVAADGPPARGGKSARVYRGGGGEQTMDSSDGLDDPRRR
eukprot:TRINITY_DN13634_c0_g1_i1.p4 TRINITY_DN13634_c0_g1~~TRINITY_DN13634_c0_g1_i1.p4  ORF type:complete len:108 (+),score=32.82 TRINITY_DN13634_c0_g1_i1:517-840(+)